MLCAFKFLDNCVNSSVFVMASSAEGNSEDFFWHLAGLVCAGPMAIVLGKIY